MLCKIVLPSKEIFKLPSLPKTYHELFTAVRIRLDESTSSNDFIIKYMDSDSELVNLHTDEDLQTAILTSQIDQVKTLRVIVVFKENSGCGSSIAEKTTIKRQSGPLKLAQALEKANIDLTQSQAFDKLKDVSMESSKAVKGASQFTLTENQMEAIRGFIGARVKQVMNENMKDMIPGLVARFQDKRTNMDFVNRSQISQVSESPTKMSYFTPTTRKADWFGDYNADSICNECSHTIQEIKYVCLECVNYKCCQECENKVEHAHPLLKVRASLGGLASSQITSMRMSVMSKSCFSNISPEDYRKRGGKNYISGQSSLIKKTGEKKVSYSGKVFLEDAEAQVIKAYPSQEHVVTVVVENIGNEAWPNDVRLCCVNGTYRNRKEDLIPLNPGTKQVLHLNLEAPSQTGRHLSQWKLCCNNDDKVRPFGESLFIEMQVEEKKLVYSKSKSSEENVPEAVSSLPKRTNLSLRRGNTFSDSDSHMIEEKRKAEKGDFSDKQSSIAKYLNEIFPGCIEEKHRFLRDCERHMDIKDMTKIIELYMRKLSRSKCDKTSKKSDDDKASPELLYTLS